MSYTSLGSLLPLGQHWHYLLNEWNWTPNLITVEHTFLKGDFIEGQLVRPRLQVQFPYGSFNFEQRNEKKKYPGTQTILKSSASCLRDICIIITQYSPQTVGGSGKFQFLLTSYHVVIFETDWHFKTFTLAAVWRVDCKSGCVGSGEMIQEVPAVIQAGDDNGLDYK